MFETAIQTASDLLRTGAANALAAAALAVVVAAIALPLRRRRPAVVHALWLLVLLKLVTPPLWTVPVRWPVKVEPVPTAAAPAPVELTVDSIVFVDDTSLELAETQSPAPLPPDPKPVNWLRLGGLGLALVWFVGSATCLLLVVVRSIQFRRLLKLATPAPPDVARQVRCIGARLGIPRCPAAWFVPGAVCPMLYAAGRPRLLLPRGLWDRLDAEQRDTLVAHELAHFRRRDHWVRYVEVVATVLYWWLPVLWWARRELREAEEQCCDAWVVWSLPSAVRDYMSAILEAVEFVSEPLSSPESEPNTVAGTYPFAPPAVPALASGMGEFRRLERRLWMIRQSKSPHRLGRPALFAVLLGAAGLPLAPTLAGQEEPVPEAPVTEEKRDVIVKQAGPPSADLVTAEVSEDVKISVSPDVKASIDDFVVSASEDVVTDKIFDARTGSTVEVRGQSVRIVHGSDLDRARADVEAARANLEVATRRLKEMEAKFGNNAKFGWEGASKPGKADKAYKDSKPKITTAEIRYKDAQSSSSYKVAPPTESRLSGDGKSSEQDRRMQKLEEKMDQLGQMLDEMRREREERERSNADKGPSTGARR